MKQDIAIITKPDGTEDRHEGAVFKLNPGGILSIHSVDVDAGQNTVAVMSLMVYNASGWVKASADEQEVADA